MRKCKICNEIKTLDLFENGCRNDCKACRQKWRRDYNKRNKIQKFAICDICKESFNKTSKINQCSDKCRFLKNVKIENECWLWKGQYTNSGYGSIWFRGKRQSAHRVSYQIFKGEIPLDRVICHNCPNGDNKKCVNPNHMWIGSSKENNEDSMKKKIIVRDVKSGRYKNGIN